MNTIQSINLVGAHFEKPAPPRYFKHHVLLVEDSSETENLIRHICETIDGNMRLKCVRTAEEAERLLKIGAHYDLIIADHFLAGEETGLDLWKVCQKKFRQIPFMITSGLDYKEFFSLVDPLLDGSNTEYPRFLPKPFLRENFQQMVEDQLEELPEIEGKTEEQIKNGTTSKRELFGVITAVTTFLTFLLTPAQIQTAKELFSDRVPSTELKHRQPAKTDIFEEIRPPQRSHDIKEIFTPDILVRMARIERRADEINKIASFDPSTWHRENLKNPVMPQKTLNAGNNAGKSKAPYDIDVE